MKKFNYDPRVYLRKENSVKVNEAIAVFSEPGTSAEVKPIVEQTATEQQIKNDKSKSEFSLTVSDNPKDRIVAYLNSSEALVEKIAEIAKDLDDNKQHQLDLSASEYGILEGDTLFMQSIESEDNFPKFQLWVLNEKILFEDLDFSAASTVLYSAGKGLGTDEDTIAGMAGAIGRIAATKKVDPIMLFDKLNETYKSKYRGSVTDLIEEEFSGRAEAEGLNVFRRPVSSSIVRGITDNIVNILVDVAATFFTMGGGTVLSGIYKAGEVAGKTSKVNKVKNIALTAKKANEVKKIEGIETTLDKTKELWRGLSVVKKGKTFKTALPVGSEIEYITRDGKNMKGVIKSYINTDNINKVTIEAGGKTFTANISNLVTNVGKNGGLSMNSIKKFNFVGGLAAKKASEVASATRSNLPTSQGFNLAEILGYYDTLTANPTSYIATVKEMDADAIASQILELKEGTGLWGNTTDQEELALALIITSMTPEMCKLVAERYRRLDTEMSVYEVLENELGETLSDIGIFSKAWWIGCTGEGALYEASIQKALQSLTDNPSKYPVPTLKYKVK